MSVGGSVFVIMGVKLRRAGPAQVRYEARDEAAGAELLIKTVAYDELRRALYIRGPRGFQHIDGDPPEEDLGVNGLLPLREVGPEADERKEPHEEAPAEARDQHSDQVIEEDSVEDSSTGQIDSVDAEPASDIHEVVELAAGSVAAA